MGRIRLHIALDCTTYSLETFIMSNVAPGSTIVTDSWRGYNFIEGSQWSREKSTQIRLKENPGLYGVHLVASLVKRLIRGTFQGRFEPKYLQNYLDEYVFRFNRRKSKSAGKIFMRLVQQAVKSAKITYSQIMWDIDPISEYFAT
ncbi:MAG: IS1595 family transposase [Desulfobacterales bacterium]|nr:IS1595 family transposase [Desulfobacterales bacterium]